jgi:PAS domain S-box-containing protein
MPVILYFSSILLTCALSGFLALYAWRQRTVSGSRACVGFLLGEGLLALAEILSMLSPTPAQAMFWFKVRYLFLAAIPVFWLVFALEYSGRKYLLSKRLLAGMFIVPAISQIMLWSNNLHGLWIQQEAGFHQNGRFWIAEIGARVPHMGFLVNSFYGMILMLIGIVLLFINAWRTARQYRGQVILVAGAASTAFVISHIVFFNLLPKTEFNLSTPGIGLSLLLITLAVFRFQFLKRTPAADSGSAAQAVQAQSERSLAVFLLIFIVMAAGIIATAYVSYKDYEQRYHRQVESNLSSVAALKVKGLCDWRNERMGDAETLSHNLAFSALAQRYLENPGDAQAHARLQSWLDSFGAYAQYDDVFFLDAHGVRRLFFQVAGRSHVEPTKQEIAAAFSSEQITFQDFHSDSVDGPVHLAVMVPILAENDANRPLGVVVLQINPHVYLYPFLQQWPIPSATAEILLIRREGADTLFLNPVKFQANSALTLRIPLKNTENLAVKAVLGQVGIMEGVDYRGVPVIGDVEPIPGSPWFLVARVDTAEMYTPLRERLWQTVAFFGLLIAASGATLGLVWRHQRARYYRGRVEAAQTLRESEAHYRTLVENIGEGIALANPQDQFTFANPAGEDIFGVPPGALPGRSLREFTTPEQFDEIREQTRQRQVGEKSVYETEISRPDGEKRSLLVTAVPQYDSQGEFAGTFGVFRDITERKRAEDELVESEKQYRTLFNAIDEGFCIIQVIFDENEKPIDYRFLEINPSFEKQTGLINALGKRMRELAPEHEEYWFEIYGKIAVTGQPTRFVNRAEQLHRWYDVYAFHIGQPENRQVAILFNDITERKRAENELRTLSIRQEAILDAVPDILMEVNKDKVYIWANPAGVQFFGEDVIGKEAAFYFEGKQNTCDVVEPLFNGSEDVIYVESWQQRKDGEKRVLAWSCRGLKDSDGNVTGALSSAHDITERKRTEAALRAGEERFRSILDNIEDGCYEVDTAGNFTFFNPALVRILGRPVNEMMGMNNRLYATPEVGKAVFQTFNRVFRTGIPEQAFDWDLVRPDGTLRSVEVSVSPIKVADGSIKGFRGTVRDITERKRAEESLRESEERYRRLVELLPDGVVVHSEGRVVFANPASARIISAASAAELTGMPVIEFVHPEYRELALKRIKQSLGEASSAPLAEEKFIRLDGTPIDVQVAAIPFSYAGKPAMLTVFNDITERKRAETQLIDQLEELRRWHEATLGRETRILDLKRELNELLGQAGQPPRYPSAETK